MQISKSTKKETILKLASCKRCGHCCSHGSGYVLDEEIAQIAECMGLQEKDFVEKYLTKVIRYNTGIHKIRLTGPHGCMLYNDGCTIHSFKPLHCRISTCSKHGEDVQDWFALNYLVRPFDSGSLREWAIKVRINNTINRGKPNELVRDARKLRQMLGGKNGC